MKILCNIYKSPREDELYLYVDKQDQLSRVPGELLAHFGTPKLVTTMVLAAGKKLARANVDKVLAALQEPGYYLQLPPPKEGYMQQVNRENHKLAGK